MMQAKKTFEQGLSLPPGLLEIGDLAFFHCGNLQSVAFPNGMRSIGMEVFSGCPELEKLYFPDTLNFSADGDLVFFSGYSIENLPYRLQVYVKSESPAWHHLKNLSYPEDMWIRKVKRSSEDRMEEHEEDSAEKERAAQAAEWLAEYGAHIDRGTLIQFLGKKFVFTGLSGWLSKVREDLNVVEEIQARGGQSRSAVSGLTDYLVVNPEGAGHGKIEKALEMRAKGKALKIILLEDLEKILYPDAMKDAHEEEIAEMVEEPCQVRIEECVIENGTLLSYQGTETDIRLPEGITAIGFRAFANQLWLRSVVLPETVSEVGHEAFANCPSLERVVFPDSIRSIGRNAFSYCISLEEIDMPTGLEKVECGTFLGCRNLKTIVLKPGIKQIGAQAFSFCDSLIRAGDPRDTFPG